MKNSKLHGAFNKFTDFSVQAFKFVVDSVCYWGQHCSNRVSGISTRTMHQSTTPYLSQIRRTRHAGHCWRSRDELIRDVFLLTPTHGRAKAGRPARTYIQQLCEDTGCCPEDLPSAMNEEEWRERVGDIRATSATWWWWWFDQDEHLDSSSASL